VFAATVDTFRWCANGLCTVFCRMSLVTFDTYCRFATVVGGMAKGLAVETLFHWSGVSEFFPCDNTMTKFMDLKDLVHVGARRECNYKYWIFGYDCTCCFVSFGHLRYPRYLYVVCDQICANILFRDVGRDTFSAPVMVVQPLVMGKCGKLS
jgi:hypothetical protein